MNTKLKRPDIQGLRALAVIGVVLYHFDFGLTGGFIGVDVFFVISGFVIAQILLDEIERSGKVNLRKFLASRFFRLIPALGLVTTVTVLLSFLIFTSRLVQETTALTAASSLFGFSNLVIAYVSGGYFGEAPDSNPLLHTWSLSVEWQFYLLVPLLFLMIQVIKKDWGRTASLIGLVFLLIGALSFFFNFLNVPDLFDGRVDLNGFYSPIGRFWEFSVGVITNLITRRLTLPKNVAFLLSIVGLLAIISSLALFDAGMQTPGRSTLVPIAGTVLMILGGFNQKSAITRVMSIRPLTWIGDLSYSIYLWHWPIVFFWKEAGFGVSLLHGALLFLLTLGLSWLTYRLVESPLRRRRWPVNVKQTTFAVALSLAPLVAIGVWGIGERGYRAALEQAGVIETIQGDIGHIDFHRAVSQEFAECTNQPIRSEALAWEGFLRCQQSTGERAPTIAVVGDSHAEHLFYGLAKAKPNEEIVYFIRAEVPVERSSPEMAEIFRQVADSRSIRIVVMSAHWISKGVPEEELRATISTLKYSGKTVLITNDIPRTSSSPDSCKTSPFLFSNRTCSWIDDDREEIWLINFTLQRIADDTGSVLVDTYSLFCEHEYCSMVTPVSANEGNQVLLYRDNTHLNLLGSVFVSERIVEGLNGL